MAHNFKDINTLRTHFVSKSGHDSNDGLTPDTPKKNPTLDCLIGAGYYLVPVMTNINRFEGDGKVILDFQGYAMNNANTYGWKNLEIRNINGSGDGSQSSSGMYNLIVRDCIWPIIVTTRSKQFYDCIVINSTMDLEILMYTERTIIANSTYGSYGTGRILFKNSYLDRNSTLNLYFYNLPNYLTNGPQYSNIQGIVKVSALNFTDGVAKKYAIQDELVGTPQDNGYEAGVKWMTEANMAADGCNTDYAGVDAKVATCMNKDPLFNNAAIGDFTLQAGSPHIGTASDGGNIGGTQAAVSMYNTGGGNGTQVIASPDIDTTNPNSYTVAAGSEEGYIDYITKIGSADLVLQEIAPISTLEFNSDLEGGTIGNQNVPDSEPLTFEYPRNITTTSTAANTTTLNVTAHDVAVGEFVRVEGEDREVISITADVITVDTAFRAVVGTGIEFKAGEKVRIGALNPNRLTFMMRTSKVDNPLVDSDWDNDIDPVYNKAGSFLTQEWDEIPGYYIDTSNNNVWGSGDSETPPGLSKNEISCRWVHIRVYIRNNYES